MTGFMGFAECLISLSTKLAPREIAIWLIERLCGEQKGAEDHGHFLVIEPCLDDQAAELDFISRILLSHIGSDPVVLPLKANQLMTQAALSAF